MKITILFICQSDAAGVSFEPLAKLAKNGNFAWRRKREGEMGDHFWRSLAYATLKVNLEGCAPGTWLVQHAGQVVKVDSADDDLLVGDVAAEGWSAANWLKDGTVGRGRKAEK